MGKPFQPAPQKRRGAVAIRCTTAMIQLSEEKFGTVAHTRVAARLTDLYTTALCAGVQTRFAVRFTMHIDGGPSF
jgi:hypothetical protein